MRISLAAASGQGMRKTSRRYNREEGGLKEFNKGLMPNLLLVVNSMIYFVLYEQGKLFAFHHLRSHTASSLLVISSLSKTCATLCYLPDPHNSCQPSAPGYRWEDEYC